MDRYDWILTVLLLLPTILLIQSLTLSDYQSFCAYTVNGVWVGWAVYVARGQV